MTAVDGLLIDLDGTVYEGEALVPGAAETLAWLRERRVPFLLTTNTSRMSRRAAVDRLAALGPGSRPHPRVSRARSGPQASRSLRSGA